MKAKPEDYVSAQTVRETFRDATGTPGMQSYRAKTDELRASRNEDPMTDAEMKERFNISDEQAVETRPKAANSGGASSVEPV